MANITITRSGQPPLVFRGEQIAAETGRRKNGRERNRWYDLRLYSTERDGQYVAEVVYHTLWQGEQDYYAATVGTARDVTDWLVAYQPERCVQGYPIGDSYRERQARLLRDIGDHYRARLGDLLTDALEHSADFGESAEAD